MYHVNNRKCSLYNEPETLQIFASDSVTGILWSKNNQNVKDFNYDNLKIQFHEKYRTHHILITFSVEGEDFLI